MSTTTARVATAKQVEFIGQLLADRVMTDEHRARVQARLDSGNLTAPMASDIISWLLRRDRPTRAQERAGGYAASPKVTEPGIYEMDGCIYRVKTSKASDRLWAAVLTDHRGVTRLTEAGTVIEATYEYAPGAMRDLRPEHRMTAERAEALSIVFTFCIRCSRHLTAADSVAAGIGPVCRSKI